MSNESDSTSNRPLSAVPDATSESEEMFLITVARAVEDGFDAPVPIPHIAESLSVSRVSANEMAKKLVGRGFVDYEPYRGVTLTAGGISIANSVLRRRRLWALFLAEHLGLTPGAADTAACEFEHVTTAEVAARLATFLGDPAIDPEGKPIPPAESVVATRPMELSLVDLEVGRRARVTRVAGDPAIRSFLSDEGIADGGEITLLAVGSDRGCLVDTPHGHVHVSAQIAADVVVERLSER